MTGHVVVVGAGLGGLRTAEHLRRAGYAGRVTLVGDEPHRPYDRPPLSKQVLTGEWEPARTALKLDDALDVTLRLGVTATRVRPGEVTLADGEVLRGDAVVVATGLSARRLPGQSDRVHTLRTLDDAVALRAALVGARSLLVVGAGFVGAEVASSARTLGLDVTVLEALPVPSARAVGTQVGALCGRLLVEAGVRLHTGVGPVRLLDAGASFAVQTAGGAGVEADVALVGIGGTPRLEWLDGAVAPDPSGGVGCGPTGRVHGLPGVWALGDVAAWDAGDGTRHRSEHWTNAGDQAAAVARDVAGAAPPAPAVPYFWSDQFGTKIQLFGRPDRADAVVALRGDGLAGGTVHGTVVGYTAGERLVAVLGFGAPRVVVRLRPLVARGASRAETEAAAAALG
ncbi:MAG: NAD(P)/FAD-dependent oxidoreductase [Pseudonocardia sp.]